MGRIALHNRFVVLGGAGTIGRVVVRDLLASNRSHRVTIAEFHLARARHYARSLQSRRVNCVFANASQPSDLARVLRGAAVVINCTQHDFNLSVMDAAIKAQVHYVDLGGLFTWTRRQLKRHRAFERAGLTAVLGMGCAPGITNLLAQYAAEQLDRVLSIKIRVGGRDLRPPGHSPAASFSFPYSAQTIVEELTLKPWIFSQGKFRQVAPRSGWERVEFPAPVGPVWVLRTRHSEVATLPVSLRRQGITFCDFKVGFDRGFVREVVKRLRRGWTMDQFRALTATPPSQVDDVEISQVVVVGRQQNRRTTFTLNCMARSRADWQAAAGDIDTGCPPSIVAQMIADGRISQRGVYPPERAVPVAEFLLEATRRGVDCLVHQA